MPNTTTSILGSIKSNWAAILAIFAAIATIINFYWKADAFIHSRTKSAIQTEIAAYHKTNELRRDSIVESINTIYIKPIDKRVKLNTYFLNQSIQGLNAEFDPYPYTGKIFYRSNANAGGYSMYWYIIEKGHRWEMHKIFYNATCDCFEYFDIIEMKKKRIQ